jgi:hypothetical protein
MNAGGQEPKSLLTEAKLSKTNSGPACVVSPGSGRLVEDGDGSSLADPGSVTAIVGNLPALKNQPAPAP